MSEQLRHCWRCGFDKPLAEFGTAPVCKQCWREYMAKRRAAMKVGRPTKEQQNAYMRAVIAATEREKKRRGKA